MTAAREQRDAEFTEFAGVVYPALLRTAGLLTGDPHHAEDLVQSALVKVYLHWGRASNWDSPHAYARKTVVNLFATWYRRRWRNELPTPEMATAPDREDVAQQIVERHALAQALAGLPPAVRAVLVLRFYEDLSVEQTARLLGCSTGTVKSRTNRGLQRLRSLGVFAADSGRSRR